MTYEFNDEQAETMWIFGNKTAIAAVILAVSGIFGIISSIMSMAEDPGRSWVLLFEYLFMIVIAVVLYRPSDNFKNIAVSEGRDVEELMQGVDDFTVAYTITAIMVIFIGLLNFFLIMSKV